jgi:hypothetical protein
VKSDLPEEMDLVAGLGFALLLDVGKNIRL